MKKSFFGGFIISAIVILGYAITVVYKSNTYKRQVERGNSAVNQSSAALLKNGDIIFQSSKSGQSLAIQLATHSRYSHCGIVFWKKDKCYVFEAVQPVKSTPIDTWIARGDGGNYLVKRLKNADEVLTPSVMNKFLSEGEKLRGKSYDLTFEWDDSRIYCSELVWKLYDRAAGVELCKPQQLRDFDLKNEEVKDKLVERYGDKIPYEEPVVSPQAIAESNLLETIVDTY